MLTGASLKVALIALAAVLLVGLGGVLVAQRMGYSLGKANQATETAKDGGVGLLEAAKGQQAVAQQSGQLHITVDQAQGALRDFSRQAYAAPDADQPLPSDSVARLRNADDRMCALDPPICEGRPGGPAAPGAAGSGSAEELQRLLPAGQSQPR